jgi:cytochrome c biogenesis protein CcdA
LAAAGPVKANDYGRLMALVLLALFGVTLLFPGLSDRMTRPLVALGARLSQSADQRTGADGSTILPSLLRGVATGLLWAPCAGPVLGRPSGCERQDLAAACRLCRWSRDVAGACPVGGRARVDRHEAFPGVGQWVRRGLGAAVLAGVMVIGLGLDTGFLTRVSNAGTTSLEQGLLDRFHPASEGS